MPPVITMMARDSLHTVLTAATPKSVATAGVLETQLPTCTKRCAWILACTGLLTPLPLLQRMRPTCSRPQISRPQPVLKEAGPPLDRLILQTHRSSWVPMRCPHYLWQQRTRRWALAAPTVNHALLNQSLMLKARNTVFHRSSAPPVLSTR